VPQCCAADYLKQLVPVLCVQHSFNDNVCLQQICMPTVVIKK